MHYGALLESPKRRKQLRILYFVIPALALLLAALYSTLHASYYSSNIQDDIMYPYLFQHPHLHDILVPGRHANILKYLLFWLQGALPYNYAMLTITNVGLSLLALGWWVALLVYVCGKRYLPVICALLTTILLVSINFNVNFTETTVRNIEYPIGLTFIVLVYELLRRRSLSRKHWIIGLVGSLLFSLALAGDSFMLYAFTAPLLVLLGVYWLQAGSLTKQAWRALGLVIGATLLGLIIRKAVGHLGIVNYYFSPVFDAKILPSGSLGPSISRALLQLTDLSGGNIFGLTIGLSSLVYFVNFGFLVVGVVGLLVIIKRVVASYKLPGATIDKQKAFLLGAVALAFIATFASYLLSNLVVSQQPNGQFADAGQARYITLLPLLAVAGVPYVLERFYNGRRHLPVVLVALSLLVALVAIPGAKKSWQGFDAFSNANRQTILNVVAAAKKNDVHLVVSGDSLGAPVRFWSHNTIQYTSIINCTHRFPYNTRKSWVNSKPAGNVGLVVDKTGMDDQYWRDCSDKQIQDFYGKPQYVVNITNPRGTQPIALWVYSHDIRQNLPWSP